MNGYTGTVGTTTREVLYELFRQGIPSKDLAKFAGVSPSTIRQVRWEMRMSMPHGGKR